MRLIGLALVLALTPAPVAGEPQRTNQVGILSTSDGPEWDAFREALRGLGYIDGENIVLEYRWHRGEFDRLPSLAAELVGSNVNVIVTSAPRPTAGETALSGHLSRS